MGVAPTLVGIYNGLAWDLLLVSFTHDFAMPKLQVRFFFRISHKHVHGGVVDALTSCISTCSHHVHGA